MRRIGEERKKGRIEEGKGMIEEELEERKEDGREEEQEGREEERRRIGGGEDWDWKRKGGKEEY